MVVMSILEVEQELTTSSLLLLSLLILIVMLSSIIPISSIATSILSSSSAVANTTLSNATNTTTTISPPPRLLPFQNQSISSLLPSSPASQLPDIYIQTQSSNTSTNATTIDTTSPETQITSAGDSSTGANVQNGITMPTSSISFTFTGTDDDAATPIARFECSIDGLAAALCKSPVNLLNNNLTPGNHTFQVRAVDTSGNADPTPASFSWTIVAAVGTLPPLQQPSLPQQPPISPLEPIPQQPPISPLEPIPQQPPISPLEPIPQQPPIPSLPTLSPL
jgi:hypothetical protein